MNNKPKIIKAISPHSPFKNTPLSEGDVVVSMNNQENFDIIDYLNWQSDSTITLSYQKQDSKTIQTLTIEKEPYEPLGLSFEEFTITPAKLCQNNCLFCFMAQMPKGMRKTLTFRDDDYRLSLTDGNYITLTNLSDAELARIVRLKLSPLHISIHTTNPSLRVRMMRSANAAKILKQLDTLQKANISFHAQIVLCPGYNDQDNLFETLTTMRTYAPQLQSLSVVPVGLTKYRQNLPKLTLTTPSQAKETIAVIESFHPANLKEFSTRLFYPSDEFFILAGQEIPPVSYYEDLLQFENGVGMVSSFRHELQNALADTPVNALQAQATLLCGTLMQQCAQNFAAMIKEKFPNLTLTVQPIENEFFGKSITVTGLLCAKDIIRTLRGKPIENLLIWENMLSKTHPVFLDDITVDEVQKALQTKITVVENNGYALIEALQQLDTSK